jgi:hypothetical protein
MDPALLDVLYQIKLKTGTHAPFQVISAYRSPETNQMLRDTTVGVAKDSMHMRGQAIDVRLEDVPLATLRSVVLARANIALPSWTRASRRWIWAIVAFGAVSLVLNLATPSAGERALWAPVAAVLLLCSVAVALDRAPASSR